MKEVILTNVMWYITSSIIFFSEESCFMSTFKILYLKDIYLTQQKNEQSSIDSGKKLF